MLNKLYIGTKLIDFMFIWRYLSYLYTFIYLFDYFTLHEKRLRFIRKRTSAFILSFRDTFVTCYNTLTEGLMHENHLHFLYI